MRNMKNTYVLALIHNKKVSLTKNAFDMKFGTVLLCNVTKMWYKKNFQNSGYRDDDVTNYVNFF